MDDRLFRYPFLHFPKVRDHNTGRDALFQMSGQPVDDIDFFRWFMELIDNISQQTASGGEHTVSDIGDKFTIGLREAFGKLIRKR